MADAIEQFDLEILNLQKCASPKTGSLRGDDEPRQSNITGRRVPVRHHGAATPVLQEPDPSVERQRAEPSELDRLYRSLAEVTSETYPRTAGLLASSTRKVAQKIIEEAGEVAIEAVRHRTRNVVRESADLLYHLVALWHRAGIDPTDAWIEMRRRADMLGIAEKPPKACREDRRRPIRDVKQPPEGNGA
ncbi:phosphoribosyl-ATP diphosphatase [Bradyrhizobium erythrophlei]|uniref:phosphoribosyl-ATP diphosphatase n=1 Tax=Bradyrhizobium erythrophlei TaxID=1437360 RepID=A0A1M7U514_9BRAD|nr:phosphoribosyl-ATP diphosphatase [Bradyrhizobium erythrophlei]SHN78043.1 phosphoribosyl-ATP pyrophosphatase [Bradyrhizobium erythrophlei]